MTMTKPFDALARLSRLSIASLALTLGVAPAPAQFGGPPQKPAGPWMDKTLSPDQRADLLVKALTLDEKISLLHGNGWEELMGGPDRLPPRALGNAGFIPGIPRLGIPDMQMADATVGVTHSSVYGRYSTPLPSTIAEASSWDVELAREYGALIGRELRDQGYTMTLGGGIDLTREPRNGRNFEYHGEDPILAGTLAGVEMKALQERHIIGDLKHYAMNDQESGRSYVNVKVGKRAMRESDLLAFEIAVKLSNAGAVMCSYNLVNGEYACENNYLLNEVLKKDFGFQGFVVSDWGATHSTAKAAKAGLDMQMPESNFFGAALKKAVESGEVPLSRLDNMVHRVLRSEFAVGLYDNPPDRRVPDVFHGLEVAERVAEQTIVLLKNANGQLPLAVSQHPLDRRHRIARRRGRALGRRLRAGRSHRRECGPLGERQRASLAPLVAVESDSRQGAGRQGRLRSGYEPSAAAALAKASDVAIVFVNQPTSEGDDVRSLSLPDKQDALVSAVAAANPHTIVVIETGGAVTMPWIDHVSAVLEAWYPGMRGGGGHRQDPVRRGESVGQIAGHFREDGSGSAAPHRDVAASAAPGRRATDVPRRPLEGQHQAVRYRIRRRTAGRIQVVRRQEQTAALSVRLWAVLHHVQLLGPEGVAGADCVRGEEHGARGPEPRSPRYTPRCRRRRASPSSAWWPSRRSRSSPANPNW